MATKDELREKLDAAGAEQPPSDAKKDELEKAVAEVEGTDGTEGLSPEGQEALAEMGDNTAGVTDDAIALDAHGPLVLQAPSEREMTGAVSEEQAKEQEKLLKNKPDDYVGSVTEAGFDADGNPAGVEVKQKGQPKDNLSENDDRDPEDVYEVRAEDVIDFPPPLAELEERRTGKKVTGDETEQAGPGGAFLGEPLGTGASRSRLWEQKAVFYTDGLSGSADHNHERAYETPEVLQSNDPETRKAGDESLSEAAKEAKTDKENSLAESVKNNQQDN